MCEASHENIWLFLRLKFQPEKYIQTSSKGRRVPELCHWGAGHSHFACMVACVFAHVATLLWAKVHMGFLLRQYPWPLAMWFRVKKEVVWQIFGKKGRCVAQPQHKRCRLMDFQRKRKRCGTTSLPFFRTQQKRKVGGTTSSWKSTNSQIFGKKGNCVAWPQNLANILYFFVYQYRLQLFAVPKAWHEKLPFLGTVCRIHIAHSIHVRSGWKLAR